MLHDAVRAYVQDLIQMAYAGVCMACGCVYSFSAKFGDAYTVLHVSCYDDTKCVSCGVGDKVTVLAEDESDDEEDEGFEGLGTEEIVLP